jgi:hypothetical protein
MSAVRRFDPLAVLRGLDEHRVAFVLVGVLAGVARGAPEETDVVEICPSLREDNLERLDAALEKLGAEPADGGPSAVVGIAKSETRRRSGARRHAWLRRTPARRDPRAPRQRPSGVDRLAARSSADLASARAWRGRRAGSAVPPPGGADPRGRTRAWPRAVKALRWPGP